MFYRKSYIYCKTPLYRFITIAPSHCHFITYRLSPADVISLSHRSISQFYILQAHFSIALSLLLKPSFPFHSRCELPMRFRNRSSLLHIFKIPCPLAIPRCDITISSQPLDLPSQDLTARIYLLL